MSKRLTKNKQEIMAEKVADLLARFGQEVDVEEVKQDITQLYTNEEAILEGQSVYNYYQWRRKPEREKGEKDADYEARMRMWQYKICEECKGRFAYSYHYDGIQFCSLDCLDKALKKIGLKVTYGRPLHLRWGFTYPGLVPSNALESVEQLILASASTQNEPSELNHPTPQNIEIPEYPQEIS